MKEALHLKPDFRIDYDHMRWEWISSHWDIHLKGLCWVNGELCRFTMQPWCYPFRHMPKCHVFRLSAGDRLRWRLRQRLFEWCVGYHWSYRGGKTRPAGMVHRNPWWFWGPLQSLYYWFQRPF